MLAQHRNFNYNVDDLAKDRDVQKSVERFMHLFRDLRHDKHIFNMGRIPAPQKYVYHAGDRTKRFCMISDIQRITRTCIIAMSAPPLMPFKTGVHKPANQWISPGVFSIYQAQYVLLSSVRPRVGKGTRSPIECGAYRLIRGHIACGR